MHAQRKQVCISVVANNGIKRVLFQAAGEHAAEQTYLNWHLEFGESIKEGETYCIMVLRDPNSHGETG